VQHGTDVCFAVIQTALEAVDSTEMAGLPSIIDHELTSRHRDVTGNRSPGRTGRNISQR
jgi:hypothetical protein